LTISFSCLPAPKFPRAPYSTVAAYAKVLHNDVERSREEEAIQRVEQYSALHAHHENHSNDRNPERGVEETKGPMSFQAPGLRNPAPPPMPPPSAPNAPSAPPSQPSSNLPHPSSSTYQAPGLRYPAPPPIPPPATPQASSRSSHGSARTIPTHGPPGSAFSRHQHSPRTKRRHAAAPRQRRAVV